MTNLPTIPKLIDRTKALATLDLILSPEWDSRYYSFNSRWSPEEQMASMRNGSGNEWWIVFHKTGWAALKGLNHETAWAKGRKNISTSLSEAFPTALNDFATEPAFRWDETNFAYFCLSDSLGWRRANDLIDQSTLYETGEEELLCHLVGDAQDYANFAEDYYEKPVPVEIVSAIFALQPVTSNLVAALNSETSLADISTELFDEITYPRSND
jgi:hypothetical protein